MLLIDDRETSCTLCIGPVSGLEFLLQGFDFGSLSIEPGFRRPEFRLDALDCLLAFVGVEDSRLKVEEGYLCGYRLGRGCLARALTLLCRSSGRFCIVGMDDCLSDIGGRQRPQDGAVLSARVK